MKTDYETLDTAILSVVKRRRTQLAGLLSDAGVSTAATALAERHNADKDAWRHKPHWRFVDARLQALRKKRLIRHSSSGWEVPPK